MRTSSGSGMKIGGSRRKASAFSLVEVTLALGVAAFALLAIFGLLPTGLNSNQTSIEQTAAANIMTGIVADLRSTASTAAATPRFTIDLSTAGNKSLFFSEDQSSVPLATSARYRATVYVTPGVGKQAATIRLLVTWPAIQADLTKAAGSFEAITMLARN